MDYKSYRLYEKRAGQELRLVELVTRAKGERMIMAKTAEAGFDVDGVTLCFQLTRTAATTTTSQSAMGMTGLETTNAAFTLPEMDAIAGVNFKHGRSRTARMSEQQRKERKDKYGIPLPPEDRVEKATNKYKAWAQIPVLMDRVRVVASL
jgi:hypothetical protein